MLSSVMAGNHMEIAHVFGAAESKKSGKHLTSNYSVVGISSFVMQHLLKCSYVHFTHSLSPDGGSSDGLREWLILCSLRKRNTITKHINYCEA